MTTRLRVAMPAPSAGSYGADSYFRAFLPAVERYGSEAEFVVLVADDRYDSLMRGRNVQLVKIPVPRWGGRYLRVLWEQSVLPRLLDRLNVDVVYTATNLAVLRSRKPCVIAVRNMDPLVPKVGTEPSGLYLNSVIRGFLSRASIRASTRIVAVSHYVKDFLISLGTPPHKIDVIYHGIDDLRNEPDRISLASKAPKPYVASASKFIRYANLTTLVRAYHRMRQRGFAGELLLAGGSLDRRYEREVRALVKELHLVPYVKFLGYVSREEVQMMLRGCSVFLFPSKLEACPFTLMEAMQQGAPIVTTTVGPMREVCGDAAVYVDPDDSESFGNAAYEIATRADIRESLATKAKARAAQFRWERSIRQLVESLRMAVDGSKSQSGAEH